MLQFVFRRTLWIIPVLITISLITFVMMKSTPGGPFDVTSSGRDMPKETQELLMRRYHLDEPDWKQYLIYIGAWPTGNDAAGAPIFKGVLQGDLGPSYQYKGRGVTDIIFAPPSVGGSRWESRFGRTATLGIFGFVFGVALGLGLGEGLGVVFGVGFGVDFGVGEGNGFGVGVGAGVGFCIICYSNRAFHGVATSLCRH